MAFVAQTIPEEKVTSKAAAQGIPTIHVMVMPSLHAIKF